MKKILLAIATLSMMISFAACTATPESSSGEESSQAETQINLEGEIPDFFQEIIENADIADDYKTMLTNSTGTMEITSDFMLMTLGSEDYEFVEGYFCEPMMSSQAFSMIMLRAEDAEKAKTLAEEVVTTVDPRKWVCVEVDPSDVVATTIGDMMFLIMAEDSEKFIEAFEALGE
ncbi:MAG: hypothetical protein R3Y33_05625 [Clostridia bacterium]